MVKAYFIGNAAYSTRRCDILHDYVIYGTSARVVAADGSH